MKQRPTETMQARAPGVEDSIQNGRGAKKQQERDEGHGVFHQKGVSSLGEDEKESSQGPRNSADHRKNTQREQSPQTRAKQGMLSKL